MRNLVLLIGVFTAGFASSASPQNIDVTALQLKACTLISDDTARVRCYDYAMSRPASESPFVTIPQSPGSGSAAPLVAIPQSSIAATSQAPPAARPQLPITTIPQSSTAATSEAPLVARPQPPIAAKSETSTFFDSIIGNIAPSTGTKVESWQVKADKLSLEEASQLLGTLASADEKATLVLKCNAKSTEAYVSTSSFLGWESPRVLYRLNGNPMSESRWSASPDGRSAIVSNAIEFIKSLPEGGTLDVRLIGYNEANHDMKFNLGAISNLRSQFATVCRWPGTAVEEKPALEQKSPNQRNANPTAPTRVGPPLRLQ